MLDEEMFWRDDEPNKKKYENVNEAIHLSK